MDSTLSELRHANSSVSATLPPEVSRKKYDGAYTIFLDWCKEQELNSFSENVLMAYFSYMAQKFKSSTLWSQYSMLKTTLGYYQNVDISTYFKLKSFIKRKSNGYEAKKAGTFTAEQINKFLEEAPDYDYLMVKVICIMGIMGSCRRIELYKLRESDVCDLGDAVTIRIPEVKKQQVRKFTITGSHYDIFKKYYNLRPKDVGMDYFFLNYRNGKCTSQKLGINKFGTMGMRIATYLQLPSPQRYTGHCFRRTSSKIQLDIRDDSSALKNNGDWRSSAIVERYIEKFGENEMTLARKMLSAIKNPQRISSTPQANERPVRRIGWNQWKAQRRMLKRNNILKLKHTNKQRRCRKQPVTKPSATDDIEYINIKEEAENVQENSFIAQTEKITVFENDLNQAGTTVESVDYWQQPIDHSYNITVKEEDIEENSLFPEASENNTNIQAHSTNRETYTNNYPNENTYSQTTKDESVNSLIMKYLIEIQNKISTRTHPIDLFVENIAAKLKTFTPYYRNIAESKIFNIVQELEGEQLKLQSSESRQEFPIKAECTSEVNLPYDGL